MPKFQVTVADEAGHKLYDETIEAEGPREACEIASRESATLDVPDHTGRSPGGPISTPAASSSTVTIQDPGQGETDGLE